MSIISDYRKRAKAKAAEAPTAAVTLPSGAVFTLRRLPFEQWVKAGRIPDFFIRMSLEAAEGGEITEAAETSPEESMAALKFMRDAVIHCVVDPPLRIGATDAEDALDPSEIDEADMTFLVDYVIKKGCPDVPVLTKEGVTSVSTLATFQQKQPGGVSAWAGTGSGDDGEGSIKTATA
jgi:hypothetical protein